MRVEKRRCCVGLLDRAGQRADGLFTTVITDRKPSSTCMMTTTAMQITLDPRRHAAQPRDRVVDGFSVELPC